MQRNNTTRARRTEAGGADSKAQRQRSAVPFRYHGGPHGRLANRSGGENPNLVDSAVEEILRWTSIVIQFARTVVEDTEIRGVKIKKGQTVGLWYPSANRDEDIFPDPYKFDITRDPNPHYAFGGYGEHFCLGANLARWELRTMFRELAPLLGNMELAGKPELVAQSLHVGGIKHLPVRYRPN